MRKPLIAATLGMLLLADLAHAQTLVATSNIIVRAFGRSIDFTSDTTTSIQQW
jgi:threonine/homoserine efflux transporter RhtA